MKALVYHGPKKVSVDKVPDAKIEKLTDVVIQLTTTNICGSDLHMYEGRTDVGRQDPRPREPRCGRGGGQGRGFDQER